MTSFLDVIEKYQTELHDGGSADTEELEKAKDWVGYLGDGEQ